MRRSLWISMAQVPAARVAGSDPLRSGGAEWCCKTNETSISLALQRHLRIGYNRGAFAGGHAARLVSMQSAIGRSLRRTGMNLVTGDGGRVTGFITALGGCAGWILSGSSFTPMRWPTSDRFVHQTQSGRALFEQTVTDVRRHHAKSAGAVCLCAPGDSAGVTRSPRS